MEGKDNIKELFSQKLGNYEAKVNPELWAKISTQVAASATTTAAAGLSVFAKVAIGLGISAAAITTVVLLTNNPEETITEEPKTEVLQETLESKTIESEKVAEITDSKIVSPANNTVENEQKTTSIVSMDPTSTSSQGATETPKPTDPDISINAMTRKSVTTVGGNESSEPTIVEGVTFGEMTNYGATPANELETNNETPTPKTEPIKRYTNTFTPNGDRANDEFFLPSEGLTDFSVVVFNPSGDIVFQSNDPDFRWDGLDIRTGEMVDSGRYMYMVSAYDAEGNPYPIYEQLIINL